jgi:outer membrane protein assembly factor BamB
MDCYAPDRYLLANEYGEPLWSISHIYVPYAGGNPMLAAASDAVVVAVKSSIISNGIAAYDLQTGRYIWGKRPTSPSILIANQNEVYEGENENIIILDAASGKLLDDIYLPGIGYIVSFYRNDASFFVFGSSQRFAIYDLTKKTMSITEPDFAKMILFKEGDTIYLLDRGQLAAKDANSGSIIWKSETIVSTSDVVVNNDMIFIRTEDPVFDGSLYAINKIDGSSAWKKDLHVISNVAVTDLVP